jgi:hypothetical protein
MFATKKLIPFKDINPQYMPYCFYIRGMVLKFFGPNFYVGRIFSVFLAFFMLIFVYFLSKKIAGKFAGVISVWLIVTNTLLTQFYSAAYPYSQVAFFMIGSLLVLSSNLNIFLKLIFSIALMGLSAFTRINLMPSFLFSFLYLLIKHRNLKYTFSIIIITIITIIIGIFPYRHSLDIFLTRLLALLEYGIKPIITNTTSTSGYAIFENMVKLFQEYVRVYSFLFIVLFSSILGLMLSKKKIIIEEFKKENIIFFIILFIINFLVHFWMGSIVGGGGGGVFVYYSAYFIPLGVVLTSFFFIKIFENIQDENAKKFIISLLIIGIFLTPIITGLRLIQLPLTSSPFPKINNTALVIKKYTKPSDKIFFWGLPQYLFKAERTTFSTLTAEIGAFTYLEDKKYHEKIKV